MIYTLRENQKECSSKGLYSLQEGKGNAFIYASCGFGKSLVIADIAHQLNEPTLVLQPQKEILLQNYEKMLSYGVTDIALYSDSVKKKEHGNITFATIGSIYKKPEEFKRYKYVLLDECHRLNPQHMEGMYGKFFTQIGNPPKLGLTGSPFRTTGKYVKERVIRDGKEESELYYTTVTTPLNRILNKKYKSTDTNKFIFGSMIYKAEMDELIAQNYLCDPSYVFDYCKAFDYSELKMNSTGANFDEEMFAAFVNAPDRVKNVLQACIDYDSYCNLNLVFCGTLRQAQTLSEMAKKSNLKAEFLSGEHSPKERIRIYNSFRDGTIKHLFNYGTMTTGVDIPWLDLVTYGRPTLSIDTYVQSCARVIRKDPNNPDKKATIIDVAGVAKRLGRIQTIRMEKEQGYKDILMSEVGQLSGIPLAKFRIVKE